MELYQCILFYNYKWQLIVGSATPEFGSLVFTTFCFFMNIVELNLLLKYIFHIPVVTSEVGKFGIILVLGFLLCINYLLGFRHSKFTEIKSLFEKKTEKDKKKEKHLTILYVASTFVLFPILLRLSR